MPFGEEALRHFMFLERPEGMDLHDSYGLAAYGRALPAMQEVDIVPRAQDFKTVGHLYRSIEAGIAHLADKFGERWLFVGPPRAQATQQYFGWPELVAVTDTASAQRAIDEILEQGEGPRGEWRDAHFGQFVEILDEFEQLRGANRGFHPVRPVTVVNVRPSERDTGLPLVTDPLTARVMDMFNVSYEILLTTVQRFFAHTEETDTQLKALADASVNLMFQAVRPLGDLVTRLPAGPDYPGRTAGPSFELFYESDYVLPHREAAWILITERIREAAAFCEPGVPCAPEIADELEAVRSGLTEIAQALEAHMPARDVHLAAPGKAPAKAPPALLARAEDFYRTGQGVTADAGELPSGLGELIRSACPLVLANRGDARVAARLVDSVLRPLSEALQAQSAAPASASSPASTAPNTSIVSSAPSSPDTSPAPNGEIRLWDAALQATRLRAQFADAAPPGLLEAAAALQQLACDQASPGERDKKIAALADLQRSLRPVVMTAKNGPHLVTNVPTVRTPLGETMSMPPQLALCRCGGSSMKPFCDAACATNGFTDDKDPDRVPDRRDTYPGEQLTIFDNRGICQHSGFCTDRAPIAFRTDQEPFVAPSGARMEEIERAVSQWPSRARSLALDGD